MSNPVTNDEIKGLIQGLDDKLDKSVVDLSNVISGFADQVSGEFKETKAEVKKIDKKYEHLINAIDGFVGRIDRYETELAARDIEIRRLEHWVEQIAKKTGVKQPA